MRILITLLLVPFAGALIDVRTPSPRLLQPRLRPQRTGGQFRLAEEGSSNGAGASEQRVDSILRKFGDAEGVPAQQQQGDADTAEPTRLQKLGQFFSCASNRQLKGAAAAASDPFAEFADAPPEESVVEEKRAVVPTLRVMPSSLPPSIEEEEEGEVEVRPRRSTAVDMPKGMSGWMRKRGEVNTSFKSRYCVLDGRKFSYYKEEAAANAQGSFNVKGAVVDALGTASKPGFWPFEVSFRESHGRVWVFETGTSAERDRWIAALSAAAKQ